MAATSVTVDLASNGHHEIRKALGSSAQEAAIAEELANHYVSHFLPNAGKISGKLTLSVQQNDDGDFTHSVTFTAEKQKATTTRQSEQEVANLDALRFDNPRFMHGNGDNAGEGEAERRGSVRARQPSVTDSVLPLESANHHDANTNASDLPCLRCAKRIIHDSKSRSASAAEKKQPELDERVRMEAYQCRRPKDKKYHYISCTKPDKSCLEVRSFSSFERRKVISHLQGARLIVYRYPKTSGSHVSHYSSMLLQFWKAFNLLQRRRQMHSKLKRTSLLEH